MVTLNNWSEEEYAKLTHTDEFVNGDRDADTLVDYILIGREDEGTPHLQCVMHTRKKIRKKELIKRLRAYGLKRLANIEPVVGLTHNRTVAISKGCYAKKAPLLATPGHPEGRVPAGKCDCAVCYCAKDGDFFEAGRRPFQGQRTDCVVILDHLRQNHTLRQILEETPAALRMVGAITKAQTHFQPERDWVTRVTVIHGATGSRKTDVARSVLGRLGADVYFKSPGSGRWFDGYHGQPCVVIDECHGGTDGLPFNIFMSLLNCEPTRVEEKGNTIAWAPKWLILTTTTPITEWYAHKNLEGTSVPHPRIGELLRRIEHRIEDVTSYDDLKDRFRGGELFKSITADPTPMDSDFDDFLDAELPAATHRKHRLPWDQKPELTPE